MSRLSLPIDSFLPKVLGDLQNSSALILQASPGSGKTTRVPPAFLAESWAAGREIWVLVPRRLAAKMAALRVAEERGEEIGQTVGYHFRFEKVSGPETRLKFLTEGLLLRLLMSDPTLANVASVVLDEFHERHIHTDVALAYLKRLQATRRPDLKILVMSATLETKTLSDYLHAPVVTLETPLHPVQTSYLSKPSSERLEFQVRDAMHTAMATGRGDILVFLPGMAEIRRAESMLLERFKTDLVVVPLHGDLSKEEQARAFQKFSKPKVILATNIAETSLTFDGVTTVIDSGLHRQASYSWWSGIPTLKTKNVSKASAIQRAGRAGRTGPGRCFRLYTQSDFEGRVVFDAPEIRRSDLAQTILEIKALGIESLSTFPWFEPPSPEATEVADLLLFELGAVTGRGTDAPLTELGRKMAAFPLHPRLSRLVLEAEKKKVLPEAALLAVRISEGEMEEGKPPSETVRRLKDQILDFFPKKPSGGTEDDLAYAVLTGFPDRVAQKRKAGKGPEVELVFASGGSASVGAEGLPRDADYFVVLDLQETQRQGSAKSSVKVRSLKTVKPDWLLDLNSGLLQEVENLEWDRERRRVQQVSRLNYGALILSETREIPKDETKAANVMLSEGLGIRVSDASLTVTDFLKAVEHLFDPVPVESALTRLKLMGVIPSDIGGTNLGRWIEKTFKGLTDLANLTPEGLSQRILGTQSLEVQRRIDTQLPTHILLKGRRVPVHYRWDQKPWIESRLQDFFGMKEGPAVLGGKLPLTLHLLAPSRRPVQVTQDLASFWKNAYPQIRKELSRKYPKHKWPESPLG